MPIQKYAADGGLLKSRVKVNDEVLKLLELSDLPNGFIGFETKSGLAQVVLSPDQEPRMMRLGKFLKKSGSPEEVINKSGACAKKLKMLDSTNLKFTSTREEVLWVYQNGPHSCMKDVDAVQVYCTDDVAVAYLELDGKVVARSVVCQNPDIGLQYVRAYGLADVLVAALEEHGYESGDLDGCNVLNIWRDDGEVMMPYVDGRLSADYPDHNDEFIVLSNYGEYDCDDTCGILRRHCCECCGDYEETTFCEHREQDLCERCYEEEMVYVDDERYHKSDDRIQELEDGDYALVDDAVYVDYRSEWHLREKCQYNDYTDEYILTEDLS